MPFHIERIYDKKTIKNGEIRILIDRLWPRGISLHNADLFLWMKDIAPSEKLRKWYNHDINKWKIFSLKYTKELQQHRNLIDVLLDLEKRHNNIVLLYASKSSFNNAVVLLNYLNIYI